MISRVHFYLETENSYAWKIARICAASWRQNGWEVQLLNPVWGHFSDHAKTLWERGAEKAFVNNPDFFWGIWRKFDPAHKFSDATYSPVLLCDIDVFNQSFSPEDLARIVAGEHRPTCLGGPGFASVPTYFPAGSFVPLLDAYRKFDYGSIRPDQFWDDFVGARCQDFKSYPFTVPYNLDDSWPDADLIHFMHCGKNSL